MIDDDKSETSSKYSDVYKEEIVNLNSVIDTLLLKLQTPAKPTKEERKSEEASN